MNVRITAWYYQGGSAEMICLEISLLAHEHGLRECYTARLTQFPLMTDITTDQMADDSSATPPRFDDFGLAPPIMQALADQGYVHPTPIQAKAIPIVLQGHDVMGAAQTGTGKTASFSLPIIQLLMAHANTSASPARHPVRALVLTPTRELADQVAENVKAYSRHTPLRSTVVFGGVDMTPQTAALRSGVEILIATPGRLLDHVQQKTLNLSQTEIFVMDEADALLKNDFVEQIKTIFNQLDSACQVIIFSATYTEEILGIAESITSDPKKKILMKYEELSLDLIKQYKVEVQYDNFKYATLADLYTKLQIGQCIIFVNSINNANQVEKRLIKDGFGVSKIHSELDTEKRTSVLKDFRLGVTRVLIATDVLSRGIDIEQIGIVINYDLPRDHAQYIHRIGRSGRFGKIGVAINFVTDNDLENLASLENHYKIKINNMPQPETINNFLSGVGGHLKLNTT